MDAITVYEDHVRDCAVCRVNDGDWFGLCRIGRAFWLGAFMSGQMIRRIVGA